MHYELFYWPTIPGRGEFVRLTLEEAGAPYRDMARTCRDDAQGEALLMRWLQDKNLRHPPFAPPFLKAGRQIIAQTANILMFLGARHALAPADEGGRLWTHQLQLTMADFVAEIHDGHHPISGSLYYSQQKREARRRSKNLLEERVPKFLGYFEDVLKRNASGRGHLVGRGLTYADLSIFHIMSGLRYAFPRAMARMARRSRRLGALHGAIARRPRIAAYLASPRHPAFTTEGIFRHYPELDR